MKKIIGFFNRSSLIAAVLLALSSSLFFSCATTNVEGEERVQYKNLNYTVENKVLLTQQELREDCDMLKYILYTCYAGIDEAIEMGFDLDGTIEEIYNKAWDSRQLHSNLVEQGVLSNVITTTMAKKLPNNDQHIGLAGNVKDSVCLYFSNIYFEKQSDKYIVSKSDVEAIKAGDEYTGPENNVYKFITEDGETYRFGVMTKLNIKSAVISINGEKLNVPAKTDKIIPTQSYWTGVQSTDKTLYMSLGDCSMAYGYSDVSESFSFTWDNFIKKISEQAKGKSNIIFDLRSNPGGYMQFPAKMLTAAYYYNHTDNDFTTNITAKLFNDVSTGCTQLVSPFVMQLDKIVYEKYYKNDFERLKPEVKAFYKKYWRTMQFNPIRKHIHLDLYASTFDELPEPDFKGNVYVLINRGSASAAEFGTEMTYLLKEKGINVTLVGENSWGGIKYGGMITKYLPHSGLYTYTGIYFGEAPTLQSIPNWKGEGMGFFPDYWATNDTILATLVELTNDEQLKETLKDLDKKQL